MVDWKGEVSAKFRFLAKSFLISKFSQIVLFKCFGNSPSLGEMCMGGLLFEAKKRTKKSVTFRKFP